MILAIDIGNTNIVIGTAADDNVGVADIDG